MITVGCKVLDEFFDGEAPEDVAEAFRQHLADCARCSQMLLGRMHEEIAAGQMQEEIAVVDSPEQDQGAS